MPNMCKFLQLNPEWVGMYVPPTVTIVTNSAICLLVKTCQKLFNVQQENIHQYLTKRKLSQLNSSIFSKSFKQKEHSDLPPPCQACFFQQISFLKPIIIKRDNPPSSRLLGFDKIYPHPFFWDIWTWRTSDSVNHSCPSTPSSPPLLWLLFPLDWRKFQVKTYK